MFGSSLSERLKAAVNQFETTGQALQTRGLRPGSPGAPSSPAPASPSPSLADRKDHRADAVTSPTRLGTSQLAETALSGLRRSLHHRPPASSASGASNAVAVSAAAPAPSAGQIAPPNPDDPATYPLPPSPDLAPTASDPIAAVPALDAELPAGAAPAPAEPVPAPAAPAAPPVIPDSDLRAAYDALYASKQRASAVLRDVAGVELEDGDAVEGWARMVTGKVGVMEGEIRRLEGKISLQESRIEEMRDTHRLESASQNELIGKLRQQLSTAETTLSSKAGELLQLSTLRSDLARAQTAAKDEEEKRTKAISLLKTVRQKLVRVEKEKDEAERERADERAERARVADDAEHAKADREREVNNLRKGFERELASVRERAERELAGKKSAWELDMITTKAAHAKELSHKATKISGLEGMVRELQETKARTFSELEARQEEAELARAQAEAMATRTRELEYQLREAVERCAVLEDAARDGPAATAVENGDRPPQVDVPRLLADAEARAEARLADLRARIRALEKEREDSEEDWAAKVAERVRELERVKRELNEREGESAEEVRMRRERERRIDELEKKAKDDAADRERLRREVERARAEAAAAAEMEDDTSALQVQIATLQAQLDDAKATAAQLRQLNKTVRDELRKVQSSVQLMERQRNPGVGYWAGAGGATGGATGGAAGTNSGSGVGAGAGAGGAPSPPLPTHGASGTVSASSSMVNVAANGHGGRPSLDRADTVGSNNEEEVNLEYLRNVIIQFLEHKEMRPNLIRVMSVILRFTPQELRRLNAKLMT